MPDHSNASDVHGGPPVYFTAAELGSRWRVTSATLAQWRSRKTGPAWLKFGGRAVYALRDIEAYEAAQRRQGGAAT